MNTGIYTITSPSGKLYVGSASNFNLRWNTHRHFLRRGEHHCAALQHAFNKYGESALVFEKLLVCAKADLVFYEQRAIDAFKPAELYNSNLIAGSQLGFRHSAETRAKYTQTRTGKKIAGWTPERRERQMAAHARRGPVSAETRAKMSATRMGMTKTEAQKQAMSERLANRKIVSGSSNYPGVSRYKGKWYARLRVGRERVHIGYFDTEEAAYAAICARAESLQIILPVIESAKR